MLIFSRASKKLIMVQTISKLDQITLVTNCPFPSFFDGQQRLLLPVVKSFDSFEFIEIGSIPTKAKGLTPKTRLHSPSKGVAEICIESEDHSRSERLQFEEPARSERVAAESSADRQRTLRSTKDRLEMNWIRST